jgi:hypothetical protein
MSSNNNNINTPPSNPTSTTSSTSTNRVEWTDEQTTALIEQRRSCNYEYYYQIPGRNRKNFWNSVAENVNDRCACNYTGPQCQSKFNGLVTNYHVS